MARDGLQSSILSIRAALGRLDGRALLAELGSVAELPMAGIAAGQSVATLAMSRLGILRGGPMNDVDVFMSPLACARAEALAGLALPQATKRLSALSSRVSSSSFAPADSRYRIMMDIIVKDGYSVLATARSDMLNEIVYSRFGPGFQRRAALGDPGEEAFSVIRAFDLDCAQVGLDIATGLVCWTPAFERFLATFELNVATVATPHHTATRYFKKKNALGCQGDDELAMATCALPGLLGLHKEISKVDPEMAQSVMSYGAKAHADYAEVRSQIEPWFREVREPTRSPMWRLAPVFAGREHIFKALRGEAPRLPDPRLPRADALSELARSRLLTHLPELILPRAAALAASSLRPPSPAAGALRGELAAALAESGPGGLAAQTASTLMAIEPDRMAAGRLPSREESLAAIRMMDSNSFLMHSLGEMSFARQGEACLRAEALALAHGRKAWFWLGAICEEDFAPRLLSNPEALEALGAEMASRPDWTGESAQRHEGSAMTAEVARALLEATEQRQAIEAELGTAGDPEPPPPRRKPRSL